MRSRLARRLIVAAVLATAFAATVEPQIGLAGESPAHITHGRQLLTASGLIAALEEDGVAVPNSLDTTAQECPTAGCDQAILTDTIRVKSFATLSQARWYAMTRNLPEFANIVVEFAPPLTAEEREGYLAAIGRLLP